ncbi:STKLD1 [Bugula neritina]|uniref:non-specific serine/threonine protein kinase n=1 Tax=Bugula neritina TaxID=10212 RepID=A0A7J7JZB4_BUGNE|nr:STKLD1 [Bugula neritina]
MENYEVVSKLGRGAQGSVFIVKRLDDGKQYILKKVECNDEAEANKAFQEAMALQELQHRFICGYKEFFVMWDEEVATMFVCIVMEYYKNGDLDNVLKRRRVSQQPIEELILKKWLGQIIEALAFVHQKQIIHSNIFMKEDLSISIGDFGVATIMGDTRTKTRTVIGSLNWLAPEVTDRPYDERSDIWSVGCITLEMATCGIYDRIQMGDQLCKIKKNSKDLDESLEEVQKTYSSELCDVIRRMLSLDVEERPTAMELVDMPYVRESLSISASPLVNFKKADLTDIKKNPLPKDKGCAGVLEYIESNFQSENCVREALSHLEEMSRSTARSSIGNDAKRLIVKSMRSHRKSEMVQIMGCKTLNNLIVGAADSDILFSREIIAIVPLAMRSHPNSTDLLLAAVTLIIALSSDEKASETIGRCGGIQDILSAIRSHPSQSELLTQCCKALWSLTVSEPNAKIVTEEKGLPDLVNIMKLHSGNTDVVAAAAAAMLSLFMEGTWCRMSVYNIYLLSHVSV